MNAERFAEIKAGYESRRGTDVWGVWPEEAMRDLLAERERVATVFDFMLEHFDGWMVLSDDDYAFVREIAG